MSRQLLKEGVQEMNYNASLLSRFLAYVMDTLLIWLIFSSLLFIFTLLYSGNQTSAAGTLNVVYFPLLWLIIDQIIFILYQVYMLTKYGATIGKMLFGMKVVDLDSGNNLDWKTALYRVTAGYGFSSQLLGLGFWRIIKSDQNLGWHDELFNSRVTKGAPLYRGGIMLLLTFIAVLALMVLSITLLGSTEFFRSLAGISSHVINRPLVY